MFDGLYNPKNSSGGVKFGYTPASEYQCTYCGSKVKTNSAHFCPAMAMHSYPTIPNYDLRLVAALERIADALEKLLKQNPPSETNGGADTI